MPLLSAYRSHTEIIERVTRGEQPPFRPSMTLQSHLEELGQLMQRCWAEDPQERPPFQQIRLALRKFNKLVVSSRHTYTCLSSGRGSPPQPTAAPQASACVTWLTPKRSTLHGSFLCQHRHPTPFLPAALY